MLKIYRRFWQVTWAEQWQYRANMLMYLFYWLVSPIVYLAVWLTVANSQGSVRGLTANDFVTYYLTLLIVDQLTSEVTIHFLAYKVQDGTLSSDLLRPVHPVLTGSLVHNLAMKVLNFMVLTPIWVVLAIAFRPDYSAVTVGSVLLAIPAIVLGFALNFLIGATITSLAFWTTRVYSIAEFFYTLAILFSGQFIPLQLMPDAIQAVARYLPYQMCIYVPIEIILNKLPPAEIARDFAVGVIWLVVFAFIFRWMWREGVKRYSAVGA